MALADAIRNTLRRKEPMDDDHLALLHAVDDLAQMFTRTTSLLCAFEETLDELVDLAAEDRRADAQLIRTRFRELSEACISEVVSTLGTGMIPTIEEITKEIDSPSAS